MAQPRENCRTYGVKFRLLEAEILAHEAFAQAPEFRGKSPTFDIKYGKAKANAKAVTKAVWSAMTPPSEHFLTIHVTLPQLRFHCCPTAGVTTANLTRFAPPVPMYHDGNRELQDRFGARALADRLIERLWRDRFRDEDKALIESVGFFFLATADAEGRPDCSFKGGPPGFVRVFAPDLLVFPDYDGNGMFKSLGNIKANPQVALLFMTMTDKPQRLRVNGRATLDFDDPKASDFSGAQLIVRIVPEHIFPNCPRYIPDLQSGTPSQYLPCEGVSPREPGWKNFDAFKDVVPPRHT